MRRRLNLTPRASAGHWSAPYVGMPWAEDFTCWGLVQLVQREVFSRSMPDYEPNRGGFEELRACVEASGWRHLEDGMPRDGDCLTSIGPEGLHIGVIAIVPGSPAGVVHNVGGMVDGVAKGAVRRDSIAALGGLQYGRLKLWRAPA